VNKENFLEILAVDFFYIGFAPPAEILFNLLE